MSLTLQKKYTRYILQSDLAKITLGIMVMATCSQVSVPWYPVPLTLQTFGMIFVACYLQPQQSFLAFLGWISMGALGFPFFASFSSGPQVLLGMTGGYLWGMMIAGSLLSMVIHNQTKKKGWFVMTGMFIITKVMILILGAAYLGYRLNSLKQAWVLGVVPFITGAVIKSVLAALAIALQRSNEKVQ